MHGKNAKFAMAALSALLYTQVLLVAAGVAIAATKDRSDAGRAPQPSLVASVASSDAQVR